VVAFLSLKRTSVQVIYLRNWKLQQQQQQQQQQPELEPSLIKD